MASMLLPDTEKTKPIYILSIAGGGIRGTIVAQFLKRLEESLSGSLHDKFDMFAGTSIGSLIVCSLVYADTAASEISDVIFTHKNAKKMMNKSMWDRIFGYVQLRPMYDGKGKTEIIHKYVGDTLLNRTNKKVMVVSYDLKNNKPRFFKSWEPRDVNVTVKDVTDSSSAAPVYYPSVHVEDDWFIDGGVCANYPTDCVYADALKLYGKDADIRILCIGTGYTKVNKIGKKSEKWGSLQWLTEGDLMDIVFNGSERTSLYKMQQFSEALGHQFIRVNGIIPNSTIDDVSEKNIQELKDIGDQWWDKYKDQVLNLLKD